jgi:hypothetical protein
METSFGKAISAGFDLYAVLRTNFMAVKISGDFKKTTRNGVEMKTQTQEANAYKRLPNIISQDATGSSGSHSDEAVGGRAQTGPILTMQLGLFDLGRERAHQSGTTKALATDISSLEDHARAMARETHRDKYDPSQNAHDRIIESEYQKVLTDRTEIEEAFPHAAANLRDAEYKVAKTPKAGPQPSISQLLVAAAILAIAVSVAPTIHDSVFHTLDDLLAWFLALICSGFIGALITWAILSGRRTVWTWVGMVAGMVMGVGLGIVRLSSATDPSERWLAIGLTALEIGVVILLEWFALGLRHSEAQWEAKHIAEQEAIDCRENTRAELQRLQSEITEFNRKIAEHIRYVEDRHNRNINIAELEAAAVKAILDGYNAGIAENRGRARGVVRRAQ